jgi:hypothetical protein
VRRVSHRNKLVGGVFGLVVLVWGIDLLTGGSEPSSAGASPSTTASEQPIVVPPGPVDLDALIASLRSDQSGPPVLHFEQVARDPFSPTPAMEAYVASVGPSAGAGPKPPAESVAQEVPFEARHELQGVLTGRVPLALIDGTLYPAGAEIDGYRLVELQRDSAVFEQGESRVILRVTVASEVKE